MKPQRLLWFSCAATANLLLAVRAAAQTADAVIPLSLTAPPMTAANIDEPHGDGTFWVRGETYKARIDRAGVVYYPRFGGAKAHTPIAFRCRGAAGPDVARDGQSLVLHHSPTLTERWETRPQGMEQTFVVTAPPATPDLTITVDVATDLRFAGHDGGLVFAADGLGKVVYGDGVVFDQKGRRTAVVPEFDGRSIALHVPAAFLAEATWPVTIDPLVNSFTISQSGDNDFHPDVVFEQGTDNIVVIFEDVFTSSDHDIIAHVYQDDGAFVRRVFFDSTADTCSDPKICSVLGGSQVLAVWDNDGSADGIQARQYSLSLNSFVATQQVTSDGIGVDSRNPDIGGGTTVGINNFGQMAVFVRAIGSLDFSVRGVPLQTNGIPQGGDFLIDGSPGCDPVPAISQNGGNPLHWAVVWQVKSITCGGGDIWWATVNLGGVVRAAAVLEADPDAEVLPNVCTHDKDSLITWHQATTSFGQDVDAVMMRRAQTTATWSQVGAKVALSAGEPGGTRSGDQNQAAVAFDGCRYSYVYMENQRPRAACMFAPAYTFSEGHAPLSATTNACGAPAIAFAPTSSSAVRFATVWQEDVGTRFEVRGAIYEGRQAGATITTIGTGCGTHGLVTTIAIDEVPSVGNSFRVVLGNLAGLPLLIAGPPAPAPVTFCGGLSPCQQGIVTILASLFASSMRVDVPCDPLLVGDQIAFQGADLGAGGGCNATLFGVPFRTTDTLVVNIR